jgi:hypothetical protein
VTKPLHTVVETPVYLRNAASASVSDEERDHIVDVFAADPSQGDEMRGSGGVRKARVAGRGKGKSGGYRVTAAYVDENAPVYLLSMLSKGDRANFSDKEVAAMKEVTAEIKNMIRRRRR